MPETKIVQELLGFAVIDLDPLTKSIGAVNNLEAKFSIFEYEENKLKNPEIYWELQEQLNQEQLDQIEKIRKEKYEAKTEEGEPAKAEKPKRRNQLAGGKRKPKKKEETPEVELEELTWPENEKKAIVYLNDPRGEKELDSEESEIEDNREKQFLVAGNKLLAVKLEIE